MTNSLFSKPLVSALIGGLVVGLLGWIAIAAGWIEGTAETTGSSAQAPLAAPAETDGGNKPSGSTVQDIYKSAAPGVVFISATIGRSSSTPDDLFPNRQQGKATGSGFVIDEDGSIVTNAHVVDGAEEISVRFGGEDEKAVKARKVGQDTSSDLAVLKVDKSEVKGALKLGDSSKAQVGDPVVAIGNPFGLDQTVTSGIVSALQRRIDAPNGFTISKVIQTDAAINPGNSGGPLLDGAGRVIGVNSQIATSGGQGGSIGIGFAVPSNTVKEVIDDLQDDGKVQRAYVGITGLGLTPEIADAVNLDAKEGVLVQDVVANGPADKAGIQAGRAQATVDGQDLRLGGDIIVKADGKKITEMEQVVDIVDSKKPGDQITLEVLRKGDRKTVKAKLANRPQKLGGAGSSSQDDKGGGVLPFDGD
ncbi:MAG: S1C family serine protease [Solirubrobacterales bacterium]